MLAADQGRNEGLGADARIDPRLLHKGGFRALDRELSYEVPKERIRGTVPAGLRGTFLRNGPGRNELGGQKFGHWFDGDGMVHAFAIRDGRVHYQNRYVRTSKYVKETAVGRITERGYGHNRPGGIFANIGRRPANCANTNIVFHGDKLLALWEGGHPYRLAPSTLETMGKHSFDGRLGQLETMSAHGKIDPRTGDYVSFGVGVKGFGFGATIHEIAPDGTLRRKGSFDVGDHPFVHDFAMSEKHLVFFLSPIAMKGVASYILGKSTFDGALHYVPSEGLRIVIVRRSDLKVVRTIDTDAFVAVHYGNAWDEGDDVVVDLVRFENFDVNEALRNVFTSTAQYGGRFARFRLGVSTGRVEHEVRSDSRFEFPTFDNRQLGRKSRYLYGAAMIENASAGFFNGIVRFDTERGDATVHDLGYGLFTSEAIFVPSSHDAKEEDGLSPLRRLRLPHAPERAPHRRRARAEPRARPRRARAQRALRLPRLVHRLGVRVGRTLPANLPAFSRPPFSSTRSHRVSYDSMFSALFPHGRLRAWSVRRLSYPAVALFLLTLVSPRQRGRAGELRDTDARGGTLRSGGRRLSCARLRPGGTEVRGGQSPHAVADRARSGGALVSARGRGAEGGNARAAAPSTRRRVAAGARDRRGRGGRRAARIPASRGELYLVVLALDRRSRGRGHALLRARGS